MLKFPVFPLSHHFLDVVLKMSCTPALARPLGDECVCSGWTSTNTPGVCNTTTGLQGSDLFQYWCTYDCPSTYASILNTQPDGSLAYNSNNLVRVQSDVSHLFTTYDQTNSITQNVTSPDYSPFQETLLELCLDQRLPGVCDGILTDYCSAYTRNEVIANNALVDFCGCYAPPNPTYTAVGNTSCIPPGPQSSPCDPLCHRIKTVQRASNGVICLCPNDVCVIDNVNINISASQVPGGITFSNLCPACGNSENNPCTCIISGTNVSQTLSNIGVGEQFTQLCGQGSQCITTDSEGNTVTITNCSDVNESNIPIPTTSRFPGIIFFILIIALILLFIVILILGKVYGGASGRKTYGENYPPP